MAYGIEITTTAGVVNDMNFSAGRKIGESSLTVAAEGSYGIHIPWPVNLNYDLLYCYDLWGDVPQDASITIDRAGNRAYLHKMWSSSNSFTYNFLFIRFQL